MHEMHEKEQGKWRLKDQICCQDEFVAQEGTFLLFSCAFVPFVVDSLTL